MANRIFRNKISVSDILTNIVYLYLIGVLIYLVGCSIYTTFGTPLNLNDEELNYYSFSISDWLINYEGGFVRRGIIGELIYLCYDIHPFSVKTCIFTTNIISFLIFLYLFWKICNRYGFTIIPLLAIFCETQLMSFVYRRDFILLLLAYITFLCFCKYFRKRNIIYVLLSNIIMCTSILIHEAFFFFVIPVLLLTSLFINDDKKGRKIITCIMFFLLPVLTMTIVSLYKGTSEISSVIWQSWHNVFLTYPDDSATKIGQGVMWLSRELPDAAYFHLATNFRVHYGLLATVYCLAGFFILMSFTYFMVLYNPRFRNNRYDYEVKHFALARILTIQFAAMLPMFTVLSCDYARTFLYCVASSIFYYDCLKKHHLSLNTHLIYETYHIKKYIPLIISRPCKRILNFADSNSHWLYPVIILLYPIHIAGRILIPFDCHVIHLLFPNLT